MAVHLHLVPTLKVELYLRATYIPSWRELGLYLCFEYIYIYVVCTGAGTMRTTGCIFIRDLSTAPVTGLRSMQASREGCHALASDKRYSR
jgi:hypothetical protein